MVDVMNLRGGQLKDAYLGNLHNGFEKYLMFVTIRIGMLIWQIITYVLTTFCHGKRCGAFGGHGRLQDRQGIARCFREFALKSLGSGCVF